MEYQAYAVGALVQIGEKILILQRAADDEAQAKKWGLPGGGVDEDEDPELSIRRELAEETGIVVNEEKLKLLDDAVYEYATFDKIRYITYLLTLTERPKITLSHEHDTYKWVTPQEFSDMPDRLYGVRVLLEHLNMVPRTGTHRINAKKYEEESKKDKKRVDAYGKHARNRSKDIGN